MQITEVTCIYHGNCLDGVSSAWVLGKYFEDRNCKVNYIAGSYDRPVPEGLVGKHIYLVDFSYKRDVIEQLIINNETVIVLDHHTTAAKELKGLVEINQSRSGVMLAWEYFFPNVQPPKELLFIEDRDLWTWHYKETKAYTAACFSFGLSIENFKEAISTPLVEMLAIGKSLIRKQEADVARIIKSVRRCIVDGHDVPVINCNHMFSSDIGDELSKGEPFSVTYSDIDGKRLFSLRSQKIGGMDVSVIAAKFGGGGHVNAAGFSIPLVNEPMVINP